MNKTLKIIGYLLLFIVYNLGTAFIYQQYYTEKVILKEYVAQDCPPPKIIELKNENCPNNNPIIPENILKEALDVCPICPDIQEKPCPPLECKGQYTNEEVNTYLNYKCNYGGSAVQLGCNLAKKWFLEKMQIPGRPKYLEGDYPKVSDYYQETRGDMGKYCFNPYSRGNNEIFLQIPKNNWNLYTNDTLIYYEIQKK